MTIRRYRTASELVEATAVQITQWMDEALSVHQKASLAVSGGKSPTPIFAELSKAPLAWSKVLVTLVDERWVDSSSEASNGRLVETVLLQGKTRDARFLAWHQGPVHDDYEALQAAAERLDRALKSELQEHPLDVVVLGMGDDGHTASWFHGAAEYDEIMAAANLRLIAPLVPPQAPHWRMTLTLAAVLAARHVVVQFSGEARMAVLDRAIKDPEHYPIGRLLASRPDTIVLVGP